MSFITRRGLFAAASALSVSACATTPPRTTTPVEGWTPDATDIALPIRRGEMTAMEAVSEAIRRAEALQPKLNFIVNSDFDRALDHAEADDGQLAGRAGNDDIVIGEMVRQIGKQDGLAMEALCEQ